MTAQNTDHPDLVCVDAEPMVPMSEHVDIVLAQGWDLVAAQMAADVARLDRLRAELERDAALDEGERYAALDAGSLRDEIADVLTGEAYQIAAGLPGCAADQVIELVQRWLDFPPVPGGDTYRWWPGTPALRFGGAR